ncbi:MAG: VOC family protein [Bacteroidota bacterium]
MKRLLGCAPVFHVADVEVSVDFYCDKLGFERPRIWGEPPFFATPKRDDMTIMLQRVDSEDKIKPNNILDGNWDVYFWVRDAQELFEEFKSNNVPVESKPERNHEQGSIEFTVIDPDGYHLVFAEEMADEHFIELVTSDPLKRLI